jgi:hypothetical protein
MVFMVYGLLSGIGWVSSVLVTVSSRPVAIANRIVTRTAFMSGVQSLSSNSDFPPK